MNAGSCTLTTQGAVISVPVNPKVSVCYEFDTSATNSTLELPYAVAINGQVQNQYASKPALLKTSRKIQLKVDAGSTVSLYLNSDAHPAWRTRPVYDVRLASVDVLIRVREVKGRLPNVKPVIGSPICVSSPEGRPLEIYSAQLTGDIWMSVSHLYSLAEADSLLPTDALPAVRTAIRKIFHGLTEARLQIDFGSASSGEASSLHLKFLGSSDVVENVSVCPLLTSEIPRTHPLAYVALITEAYRSGISEISISSGWRPTLGSIVHRAGLGLDVYFIASAATKIKLNRAALINPKGASRDNVSPDEASLFNKHLAAQARQASAKRQLDKLKNKDGADAEEAKKLYAEESYEATRAKNAWEAELRKTEPEIVHQFRSRLTSNKHVSQLLDPWYLDFRTNDQVPGDINQQCTPVEKLHNNHLHITINEPKIL